MTDVERTVVISSPPDQPGYGRAECRALVGRKFPITGLKGDERGQGRIVAAQALDPLGLHVRLRVRVPEHLAATLEPDTGSIEPA